MSLLLTALINHILSLIESEIVKQEPATVAAIAKELEVLVAKLESYIALKNAQVAVVVNPVIESVAHVAIAAIDAAGQTIESASSSS